MNTEWHSIALQGVRSLEKGDRLEARALLKQAVALNPTEAWPYIKCAETLDEPDLKVHLYERSIQVEATDWAFIGLITIHLKNGRFEAAYRAFKRANAALSDISRVRTLCPRILEVAEILNAGTFNWQQYLKARPRLSTKDRNPADVAIQHYLEVGRLLTQASAQSINLPGGFNRSLYQILHPETAEVAAEEVYLHFLANEPHDAALYSADNIPRDFDPGIYRMLNPDLSHLSNREATVHYLTTGKQEKRLHNTGLPLKEMHRLSNVDVKAYEAYRNNCVIFINHEPTLTGAPLFLRSFSDYMAGQGRFQNVIFLDSYVNPAFSQTKKDDRIVQLYHNNDIDRLREIIGFFNPLLIYSNSLNIFLKNIQAFEFIRYRTLFHLHEAVSDATNFRDLSVLKDDRVYVVSDHLKNEFTEVGLQNVKAFPPFLTEEAFSKLDAAELTGKTKKQETRAFSPITIGMCGTICERKNFELFRFLSQNRPDLRFLWIGAKAEEAEAYSSGNLTVLPFTPNPYEHFREMDYFFLTSKRDPCPIVVLEALYLNRKVIVLDGNISYEHPENELEDYITIKDHNNDADTILAKFNALTLSKTPLSTRRNQEYIRKQFSTPRLQIRKAASEQDVVALSYYVAPEDSKEKRIYYTNLINQFLLRNDRPCEVVIQLASDAEIKEEVRQHFTQSIQSPVRVYDRPNRGFDIGGLMASVKQLFDENPNREGYLIYLHTKRNEIWRELLHRVMFCDDYDQYDTVAPEKFTVECKADDLNRPLFSKYDLFREVEKLKEPFLFVAGTTFITKFRNLVSLYKRHDEINSLLTDADTDDHYWRQIMLNEEVFKGCYEFYLTTKIASPIDIDAPSVIRETGCKNYFELLTKYNRRGIPDCQFEHALERLIGHLILDGKRVRMV